MASPPSWHALLDRFLAQASSDPRVRGVWLTGSRGSGTADELSDVDLFVLVAEAHLAAYVGGWLTDVAPHYRPLLARRLGPAPVFHHILPGWLRWDVVVGGPAQLHDLDADGVQELLNRDGVSPAPLPATGPDRAAVRGMTEEFLRVLGLLPVVVGRGELVTAADGAMLLRQLLTTLLRYRVEGPRLSGALHLSRVLPADELAALAALPPVWAERGAVVRAHLAVAAIFLPAARDLLGPDHPVELEAACREHLHRQLGLDLPA
ncbi:nucleotidyltransferase domain-containing protein [Nocardioides mesophilus]|uniref:Nucleotidyltransferase domain-containing protein n=1 Tax=Nocardioides mesophilus TaxID=433659 RepID=A0A7G9R9H2_9ACTN|nr:nucleotidyltransferase domain-containing protein [Nocardioides mesophilus]QNN52247.1 nucleotidyltransferase domain-containing protein [Nocardioides mesophilus]